MVGLNCVLITTRMVCSIRGKNEKILVLDHRNILVKIAKKSGHFRTSMNWFPLFTTIAWVFCCIRSTKLVTILNIHTTRDQTKQGAFFFHHKAIRSQPSSYWCTSLKRLCCDRIELNEENLFSSNLAIYYYKRFDLYLYQQTFISLCCTFDF